MTSLNFEDSAVYENPQSESDGLRSLRESTRLTTDALCDAGYKASAAVMKLGDGVYQVGSRAGARVARQVENQPMKAALVAAALGLIVGMLLPRR